MSKEALSEIDQAGRDQLFFGDSIEKKRFLEDTEKAQKLKQEKKQ